MKYLKNKRIKTWLIYKTLDDYKKEFEVCAHVVDFVEHRPTRKKQEKLS